MRPLANAEGIWLALTAVYLLMQPAWSRFLLWSARRAGTEGGWVATLSREPQHTWLGILWQIVYSLGIPYGALLLGIADARRLGIAGVPSWPSFATGALVGLMGVVYLAWSWSRTASAAFRRGTRQYLLSADWEALRTPQGWAQLALDALCLQASWAFVRGAVIAVLGLYPGVFLGPALVGAAWLAQPGNPEKLVSPESRARVLVTVELAIITALAYLNAENLWLGVLVHAFGFAGAALMAGRAYAHRLA